MNRSALSLALAAVTTVVFSACDSPEAFLGGSVVLVTILALVALALIVYAVIELIKSPMPIVNKVIWGLVIWFIPFIGAILFLVIGRK